MPPARNIKILILRAVGGRGVIQKDKIDGPFNKAEQIGYLKILVGRVWGIDWRGREGGWLLSYHFRLSKRPFNFESTEHVSKFLQLLLIH